MPSPKLAVPPGQVTAALAPWFRVITVTGRDGAPVTDETGRVYVTAARR